MTAATPTGTMNIGEVLALLAPDFPDVSISKIRFLESEGLVEPRRSPSGYRKFDETDIERLRYVLQAQRDHYLPLRVIKDHLDAIDRGLEPPSLGVPGPRVPASAWGMEMHTPPAHELVYEQSELRLSRAELCEASGLDSERLRELEDYGLITSHVGFFDADALAVTKAVAELGRYGLRARHLRAYKTAADREVGMIEQVLGPYLAHRDRSGHAEETAGELALLSVRLHAALLRAGLRNVLD